MTSLDQKTRKHSSVLILPMPLLGIMPFWASLSSSVKWVQSGWQGM